MGESSYAVRRGVARDAESLRMIRLESLRDTPDAFGAQFDEVSAWPMSRWREVAAGWHYYVGEVDGDVVGLVSGEVDCRSPGQCWMFGMYVSPPARGTGLAGGLVDAVCGWARENGASELRLHVTETQLRARAFYAKVGFELTGGSMTMQRDPSVRLLTMAKRLD